MVHMDIEPGGLTRHARIDERGVFDPQSLAFKHYALEQQWHPGGGEGLLQFDKIALHHAMARMHQAVGKFAIGCDDDQSLAVLVEPAGAKETQFRQVTGEQVEDGVGIVGVVVGTDETPGFMQRKGQFGLGRDADGFAADRDLVETGGDLLSGGGGVAVDPDLALDNERFRGAARAHAGIGEMFLDTDGSVSNGHGRAVNGTMGGAASFARAGQTSAFRPKPAGDHFKVASVRLWPRKHRATAMLRLLLPPNLTAAAARDAVAVKVELNREVMPPPELLPVLAVLQRICGPANPPIFLQLTCNQLGELADAARGQAVFVENGRVVPWRHDDLLAEQAAQADAVKAAARQKASDSRPAIRPVNRANPPGLTPLTVDGSEHFLALTLPSPEHASYRKALELVKGHGFVLEPSNRKWWLRDRHKTLNFLADHGARLRDELEGSFTANFEKYTAHLLPAEIVTEILPAGGEFAVTLALRAGSADDTQLRGALATSRNYLEADGKIYLLAPGRVAQLVAAQRALAGDPAAGVSPRRTQRVSAVRVAEAEEILEALSPAFQAPAGWRNRSAALRNLSSLVPAPLPAGLDRQLRPYQRLGVAWLWHLQQHGLGGVLADEMGLGKTIQALALLSVAGPAAANESSRPNAPARGNPPRPPSLVIAPASLLENWRREAGRFAGALRVFVHHGEKRLTQAADFAAFDLVITSYGTLARDRDLFATLEFVTVIADEAQHIKNRRSQNAVALRTLRARARFLLTGTPLENSLDDLRSLFEFLLPGYLQPVPAGTRGEERTWFDARLCAQTAPYILRRTKRTVAPELPEKIEQTIWCELTPVQAALYRDTQGQNERELTGLAANGASENRLRFAALTHLLRLRQICCDPRLVAPPPGGPGPGYDDSTKLDAFRELLAEALDDGHRLLVFSQFTSLLALLRAELDAQDVGHCYLDGAMSARARQAEVDRFQATGEVPVFLLSLKAGGTGLNLTGADTVVHFDPWWNPAAEAQATDRAHRIGQTRTVTGYKLIAAGTVEEKVLALQAGKRALLADVFEASDAAAAKLSLADLLSLAK